MLLWVMLCLAHKNPDRLREAVSKAVILFEQSSCGFSDCLIVAKHAQLGCEFTATFDRGMRKQPGVKVL